MIKLKLSRAITALILVTSLILGLRGIQLIIYSLQDDFIYTRDIAQEYVLAKAIWAREDPYRPILAMMRDYIQPDIAEFEALPHPTPHPPSLALFLLPVGLLEYKTFVLLWLVVESILLTAAIFLLLRWLDIRALGFWTPVITIALLGWIPVALDLSYGQLSIPLLFLVSSFWLTLQNGRDRVAGTLLGISIALKIMVWPLSLILFLRHNWRALVWCLLIVFVTNLAALGIMGIDPVFHYYTQIAGSVSSYYRSYAFNHSLHTLGWRMFHRTGSAILSGVSAEPLLFSTEIASILSVLAPLGLLVWAIWLVQQKIDLDLEFALLLCVSVLISPVAWIHYFVLLIIPMSVLMKRWVTTKVSLRDTLFSAIVLLLILFMYDQRIAALISWLGFERRSEDIVVPFYISLLTLLPMIEVLLLCLLIYRYRKRYRSSSLKATTP